MREYSYAKEPFDLKLMTLRLIKHLWILLLGAVLGFVVSATGYYLIKVVFGPAPQYEATSHFYVEYAVDPSKDNYFTFINEYTWNVWVGTDAFAELMYPYLEKDDNGEILGWEGERTLQKSDLRAYISADLPSDWRLPSGTASSDSPAFTMNLSQALEKAFLAFADSQREIQDMKIIDSPKEALMVRHNRETLRVGLLGALAALFAAAAAMYIYYILDDSIWVPSAFERRYGIPMLGTLHSRELQENFAYIFKDAQCVAVTAEDAELNLKAVCDKLTEALQGAAREKSLICIPGIEMCPEAAGELRRAQGRLLVVRAGEQNGKRIEHTLRFMDKQDCPVTAALLWEADEKLIRVYYKCAEAQRWEQI